MTKQRIVTTLIKQVSYEGGDLSSEVERIRQERSTGALTVNFSEGGVRNIEWKEHASRRVENIILRKHLTGIEQ